MGSADRAVVIGSGIGGSAVAALLAKQGFQVLLLERNRFPGGKAGSYEREGFTCDMGVHYAGRGERGPLGEVARQVSANLRFIKRDPFLHPDLLNVWWLDTDRIDRAYVAHSLGCDPPALITSSFGRQVEGQLKTKAPLHDGTVYARHKFARLGNSLVIPGYECCRDTERAGHDGPCPKLANKSIVDLVVLYGLG